MSPVHEPGVLEALEALGGHPFEGTVWRVIWKSRDVLGVGGGGRWNHSGRPNALYSSVSADGAVAEIYYHLSRAPVFSSSAKCLYRLSVRCENTLILDRPETLLRVGLTAEKLADDPRATRDLAHAAMLMDHDSLLVPSLRWECLNLVLFESCIDERRIDVGERHEINWPGWRERHDQEVARVRREGPRVVQALRELPRNAY